MRVKEEIKRSGFFWLPSANGNPSDALPDDAVFGTLSISNGGNIELELSQPLVTDIQEFKLDGLNQILGHVKKDGPITLDRCYHITSRPNIVHNVSMGSEVIRANRVFAGIRCKENVNPRFNTMTFSIEGIDVWVGISGIEVDTQFEHSAATILYNRPEDISFNIKDGMQLLITFAWTPPGFPNAQRAEVSQKTSFKLISEDPRELDEFISVAQKITAFLCFVMNKIVCLDSISATSNDIRQDTGNGHTDPIPVEVYCPTWPYTKNEPEINELDILFRFKEIQSRAESIVNKWLDNYEQITPAFDMYFWAQTAVLPSWNMQFLTLVQGLEAFHRRTSGGDISLRNRFEKMTEPFDNFMCGENRPKLIKKIVKTRNYLTHYDSKLESKAAKGKALRFLCFKMNALFRLQFLKLIGFNEQEIDHIVDKCIYLKGQCNLNPYLSDEEK